MLKTQAKLRLALLCGSTANQNIQLAISQVPFLSVAGSCVVLEVIKYRGSGKIIKTLIDPL